MRKSRREVTRKNQKTDKPRIARMARIETTEKTEDRPDVTDGPLAGVRRGGRPTIIIGFATARSRPAGSF
jgi:hypothetical protein